VSNSLSDKLQLQSAVSPTGLPPSPLDTNSLHKTQPLSAASSPVAADTSAGLSGVEGSVNYNGTAARVVDSDVTITGIDNLNGARVLIGNFDASKDRLGIDGATSGSEGGVTWNYDQVRGTLTLDSSSPVSSSVYQGLLRRVTYANTDANNPGAARIIQFSLGNLLANPENGHFYQFVTNNGISWTDADAAADNANNKYFGRQGYLVTITNPTEQNFVQSRVSGNGWIGASDAAVEGDWRWVTGPEGAEANNGGTGRLFWRGTSTGNPIDERYNNWDFQRNEPNNSTDAGKSNGEDYAHIVGDANAGNIGKWNDLPDQQDYTNLAAYRPQGYILEFGGLSADTPQAISASVTLNFGGVVGSAGTPAVGTTTNVPNFTGDASSRPEILWRNYSPASNPNSGLNAVWTLDYDAANPTNAFTLNTDPKLTKFIQDVKDLGWEIEGLYDIDTNGITDIFWRNYRTGENAVWFMRFDANTGIELDLSRTQFLTRVDDLNWEMEGVTNFDNTGGPEILWHNYITGETAIWAYNFDNTVSGADALTLDTNRTKFVGPTVSVDWEIEGWADFNKDNVADILWRNYKTGENAIWKLNTTTTGNNPYFNPTDSYFITGVTDPQWEIADVTDFDRDGIADIVWRNYRTGENSVWGMLSGGDYDPTKTDFTTPRVEDTQWVLEGTADFTGDNVPDLLWRNYATGENAIWRMKLENSKLVLDAGFFITQVQDLDWEIEGSAPTNDEA
jgi:Lectin C-type domain